MPVADSCERRKLRTSSRTIGRPSSPRIGGGLESARQRVAPIMSLQPVLLAYADGICTVTGGSLPGHAAGAMMKDAASPGLEWLKAELNGGMAAPGPKRGPAGASQGDLRPVAASLSGRRRRDCESPGKSINNRCHRLLPAPWGRLDYGASIPAPRNSTRDDSRLARFGSRGAEIIVELQASEMLP